MLRYLIDRILSHTICYLIIAFITWQSRHNPYAFLLYAIFAFISFAYVGFLVESVDKERRIHKLGGHAAVRRSNTPFQAGIIFSGVRHVLNNTNLEFWQDIFGRFGNPANPYTVEAIPLGQRLVFIADEENIKAVLATQFQDFGKGPQFRKEWRDFLGLSIFTTDGEQWHSSRQLLRPQFIKDRVSDLHTFEKHVQVLLPLLSGSQAGETVRADDLLLKFTLDAATDFLLGRSVDSLTNPEGDFAEAFGEVQHVQSLIARAGPLQGLVRKSGFFKSLKIVNAFVKQYIDSALRLSPEELEKKTRSDEGYTFLHALAAFTRDREVLRDQLVAVLLAGRDTTASTLSWLVYELSRHPQVVQKLRREIGDSIGFDRQPTYDDLKSMRYLQHTINETLRLYPVLPYNVRVALHDTTLPRGGGPDGDQPIAVLKDTPIGYSTLVLQRREDIYPPASSGFPNHLEFVPERWDSWTPKPWTYIPFNGGPRICIGQQFALTEMAYTVCRLLQTFARIECRTDEIPQLKSDIVLQPAHGVRVAFFKEAKGQ